jgi:redox-sensitive bicupin YhaK (pirin superfamily)
MIQIRRADDRGHANHGWLETYFTFSFADYFDPEHMGFRALRVLNEDTIQGGKGFPSHPHRDMEIVTYILEGALEHKDSMGTGSVIRCGEVQRMSAGTGVVHSEYNHSPHEPVHLLQIWILPESEGIAPGYEQKLFAEDEKRRQLRIVGSRDGRDGSVTIHQDVALFTSQLEAGEAVTHVSSAERHAWIQVARGQISVLGEFLSPGDGAAVSGEGAVTLTGVEPAEVILFDLA